MIPRWTLAGLLSLLVPSCAGLKSGRGDAVEAANPYELTDNAGYSPGGFYGDPAVAGHTTGGGAYPAPGQTFGGYGQGASAGAHATTTTSDHAQIAPFSESGYSEVTSAGAAQAPSPKPAANSGSATARQPAARPSVASTPKKPSPGPSSTAARRPQNQSRTTAGTKGGSVVKAVYHPSGSSTASTKKKATLHRVHTVKPGDTLSALASRYDVSVAAMKKQNQLSSDLIRVGQRLAID